MQRIQLLALTVLSLALVPACTASDIQEVRKTVQQASIDLQGIDLQGHRGARGLYPENTIPAFIYALDLGVTTLEMDIAITADGNAVVSHEPWMSAKICSHPDGRPVTAKEEKSLRIYAMSDEEVAGFDCGSRGHPEFPQQKPMAVSKPLLSDLLQAVAKRSAETGREPVLFNIEIKSLPSGDRLFHPEVQKFADILYQTVKIHGVLDRTTVQSFDPRALEATHAIDAGVSTALLIENSDGFEADLSRLGFIPSIYSPNYKLLNADTIKSAHDRGIQVIPWTVNNESSMRKLVSMGVDGLITDYPKLGIKVLTEFQNSQ
jgi:glycerophosphoryl diester phosphodiesterase